jgi:hypothetical protein
VWTVLVNSNLKNFLSCQLYYYILHFIHVHYTYIGGIIAIKVLLFYETLLTSLPDYKNF